MQPTKHDEQFRVLSPLKDEEEKKRTTEILKRPSPQFPEEPNPIEEGVALHGDGDKTKADILPGPKWTKISRKMVNPKA